MCNTELGKFCADHENWKELLVEEPYCLKIKEYGPHVIFNYDQIRSDFNNSIVREARGIIFRNGEWENPVCWAFNKFGNYGESYVPDIDWPTSFVTEKVDGSLIKVWADRNLWYISTNGVIDAWKADTGEAKMHNFGYYFSSVISKYHMCFSDLVDNLDPNLTYMFELVGPFNRVVIPYGESAIYFLGARNKYTGEEYICNPINAENLGVSAFDRPTIYPMTSLADCIKATEAFGWDQEGFVVCDANFNRVKIKSPAYVMAHYARNNNVINKKHLIKVILSNEVEEFLCYAEDYKEELLKTQELIEAFYKIGDQVITSCKTLTSVPRSTYAEFVKTLPGIFQDLAFNNYNRTLTTKEYTSRWNENKWNTYLEAFERLLNEFIMK